MTGIFNECVGFKRKEENTSGVQVRDMNFTFGKISNCKRLTCNDCNLSLVMYDKIVLVVILQDFKDKLEYYTALGFYL